MALQERAQSQKLHSNSLFSSKKKSITQLVSLVKQQYNEIISIRSFMINLRAFKNIFEWMPNNAFFFKMQKSNITI